MTLAGQSSATSVRSSLLPTQMEPHSYSASSQSLVSLGICRKCCLTPGLRQVWGNWRREEPPLTLLSLYATPPLLQWVWQLFVSKVVFSRLSSSRVSKWRWTQAQSLSIFSLQVTYLFYSTLVPDLELQQEKNKECVLLCCSSPHPHPSLPSLKLYSPPETAVSFFT